MKKLKICIITLALLCILCIVPAMAEETHAMGYVEDPDFVIPNVHIGEWISSYDYASEESAALPEMYDLREYGLVTPVRDQDPYGTCWSFAIIASLESNILKNNPGIDNNTLDLSELQLAYFLSNRDDVTIGNVLPELAGLTGDYVSVSDNNYLFAGGNYREGTLHLSTGIGLVPESEAPYSWVSDVSYAEAKSVTLSPESAVNKNAYILSNATFISIENQDEIKQFLMEKGCGDINYYHNENYLNTIEAADGTVLMTNHYQNTETKTNHAVTLVGWDDSYSKENFTITPEHDGAWLCKNSWGTDWGEDGYFWISYEDTSLGYVAFFEARPADTNTRIYQYDGSTSTGWYNTNTSVDGYFIQGAMNTFVAAGDDTITDVSFSTLNPNVWYTIEVFVSGTKVITQEGMAQFCGYHVVPLTSPVFVQAGETFQVKVTYKTLDTTLNPNGGNYLSIPFDMSSRSSNYNSDLGVMITVVENSAYRQGQGTYCYSNGYEEDGAELGGNFRIKAFAIGDRFEETGFADDPYLISSADDLSLLADMVNAGISFEGKYFKVTNNIDMSSVCGPSLGSWTPIGTQTSLGFQGTFDGNNYVISNLYISEQEGMYLGLFGKVGNAELKNIRLENVYVSGSDFVGGLVGFVGAEYGTFRCTDCHVSGQIYAENEYTGGLIGCNEVRNGASVFERCSSSASVTGAYWIGGLVGCLDADYASYVYIDGCSAYGSITGSQEQSSHIGGLIGVNAMYNSTYVLTNAHTTVDVSGAGDIGGLIGYNAAFNSSVVVMDSDSSGTVYGTQGTSGWIGGLIGENFVQGPGSLMVINCTSSADVVGYKQTGGLIGYNGVLHSSIDEGKLYIVDSHATGSVSGSCNIGGLIGYNEGWLGGELVLLNSTYAGTVTGMGIFENNEGNIGGLIGHNMVNSDSSRSVIQNCSTSGIVTWDGSWSTGTTLFGSVGGLVGMNEVLSGSIALSECWSDSTVLCDAENIQHSAGVSGVGGLVGSNVIYQTGELYVINSKATSDVFGADCIGGLVGDNYVVSESAASQTRDAASSAVLIGSPNQSETSSDFLTRVSETPAAEKLTADTAGKSSTSPVVIPEHSNAAVMIQEIESLGIMSGLFEETATSRDYASESTETPDAILILMYCYASGNVVGERTVGGLVGESYLNAAEGEALAIGIGNSVALNPTVIGSDFVDPVVGNTYQTTYAEVYALGDTTSAEAGTVSITDARTQSFYEDLGFDFSNVWKMDVSLSPYPIFLWQSDSPGTVPEPSTPSSLPTSITLHNGWNFISVPKILDASCDTAGELFGSLPTGGYTPLCYENGVWYTMKTDTPITPLNGYWIYVTEQSFLPLTYSATTQGTPPTKILSEGWNAVGLCANNPMKAYLAFQGLDWVKYLQWDAAAGAFEGNPIFQIETSGIYANDRELHLGSGGWLYLERGGTYTGNAM